MNWGYYMADKTHIYFHNNVIIVKVVVRKDIYNVSIYTNNCFGYVWFKGMYSYDHNNLSYISDFVKVLSDTLYETRKEYLDLVEDLRAGHYLEFTMKRGGCIDVISKGVSLC